MNGDLPHKAEKKLNGKRQPTPVSIHFKQASMARAPYGKALFDAK
jgi:hypothetical protein